jgi:hypothetical protein
MSVYGLSSFGGVLSGLSLIVSNLTATEFQGSCVCNHKGPPVSATGHDGDLSVALTMLSGSGVYVGVNGASIQPSLLSLSNINASANVGKCVDCA